MERATLDVCIQVEVWNEGLGRIRRRPQGWGSPGLVAAQSGNAGHGYWEPRLLLLLVRRRQFANKSCPAQLELHQAARS